MAQQLPQGAQIPVQFSPGDALTADMLNDIQNGLLVRILTHTHSGNSETDQEGVELGETAIANGSITETKLSEDVQQQLARLKGLSSDVLDRLNRLEAELLLTDEMTEYELQDLSRLHELERENRRRLHKLREQVRLIELRMEHIVREQLELWMEQAEESGSGWPFTGRGMSMPTTAGHFSLHYMQKYTQHDAVVNVSEAEILEIDGCDIIEVRFRKPYKRKNYYALVTLEAHELRDFRFAAPVVLQRTHRSVRFGFWDGSGWVAKGIPWQIVIFGELFDAESP